MSRDYEAEAQRVRKRLKETLTGREKLANWWEYHKAHVAAAAVLLLFVAYFALQDRAVPDPDYTAAWVSGQALDGETEEALSRLLARYGQDLNGDGLVVVNIHQIKLDLASVLADGAQGQQEYGELLALNADLEVGQSGLFLTDDPASLQAYTGALLYRDGTQPAPDAPDAPDWENMVASWELEGAGTVYAGCRGCWKDDQRESWSRYWALWESLLADIRQ